MLAGLENRPVKLVVPTLDVKIGKSSHRLAMEMGKNRDTAVLTMAIPSWLLHPTSERAQTVHSTHPCPPTDFCMWATASNSVTLGGDARWRGAQEFQIGRPLSHRGATDLYMDGPRGCGQLHVAVLGLCLKTRQETHPFPPPK